MIDSFNTNGGKTHGAQVTRTDSKSALSVIHRAESTVANNIDSQPEGVSLLARANQSPTIDCTDPRYDHCQQDHRRSDLDDPSFCDDGDLLR